MARFQSVVLCVIALLLGCLLWFQYGRPVASLAFHEQDYIAAARECHIADSPLSDLTFWQSAGIEMGALVLIAVGVVAALARVLLRLAMSQLHLGNDADERVTMVNTYLALRQAEHANEQHMQIVLERLFAPASDGIVKTDLGPITAGEAAHGLFTSKP